MEEPEAGVPSNTDRAALARIVTVINEHDSCEGALDEVQRIAVTALIEPVKPSDYWHRWIPDPEHINALPFPLRNYIHDLETRADPAGDVAAIALLKDTVTALQARIHELESANR